MIRIVNTKPRRLKRTLIHVLEVVAHALSSPSSKTLIYSHHSSAWQQPPRGPKILKTVLGGCCCRQGQSQDKKVGALCTSYVL